MLYALIASAGLQASDDGVPVVVSRAESRTLTPMQQVAGTLISRNDTRLALCFRKPGYLVIGTAILEGVDRLHILAFHPHRIAQPPGQALGSDQGGHLGNIVDARFTNQFQIAFQHGNEDTRYI